MFDIGMTELLMIGIVALIVIGPKDLPGLFHNLGRITARLRALARDFSRAMSDAARESGVEDVAKGLKAASNPKAAGLDILKDAADGLDNWDLPDLSDDEPEGKAPKKKSGKKPGKKCAPG